VNFLFTSCEATCPLLVRQMQDVERNTRDLGDEVRFLSVTVDPETDTPEVLRTYAARRGVDFARWSFLTGGLEAVERAVVGAFQSPMGKRNVAPEGSATTLFEITHGEHFVLVDRKARIRAFHQARSVADVEAMVAAIRSLVQETSVERELAHDR
jgi:protein SCO1/2